MKRVLSLMLGVLLLFSSTGLCETIEAFGMQIPPDTRLLDFDAAGIQVTDADALAALMDQLPALEEVRLYDSAMAREDMERLFDAYPQVFFGWTLHFATHTVRTDATAFSTLHHSTIKDKKDYEHTNKDLSQLRMCKHLRALDLGHNLLTDISFVSELPQLRVLIIAPNYDLADLSPLASLEHLEYLEVFSTDTRSVEALAGMTHLMDLNLACSHYLHDLSPLYELPGLERFWCGRGGIDQEEQERMEEKHPDCQFDWINTPTDGGWREHPRYEIVREMFAKGEYIAFDAMEE